MDKQITSYLEARKIISLLRMMLVGLSQLLETFQMRYSHMEDQIREIKKEPDKFAHLGKYISQTMEGMKIILETLKRLTREQS